MIIAIPIYQHNQKSIHGQTLAGISVPITILAIAVGFFYRGLL